MSTRFPRAGAPKCSHGFLVSLDPSTGTAESLPSDPSRIRKREVEQRLPRCRPISRWSPVDVTSGPWVGPMSSTGRPTRGRGSAFDDPDSANDDRSPYSPNPVIRLHAACSREPRRRNGSLPGCLPRRVGLGHLQPTFFRFSKTCTRLVPRSLSDPLVEVGRSPASRRDGLTSGRCSPFPALIELGLCCPLSSFRRGLPLLWPSVVRASHRSKRTSLDVLPSNLDGTVSPGPSGGEPLREP